jgi:hypothetical protein
VNSVKIRELVYFSMKIESRDSKRVTKERKKEKMGIDILNLKQPFLGVHLLHKLWVTCSYSHFVSLCNEVFEDELCCNYNSIAARLNAGEFV